MRKTLIIIILLTIAKAEAQSSALAIADSLYATGNYIHAINQYSEIGSQKSSLQIARAYNAIGNYDKAIVQYEDVVANDTTLQIARFELGKQYFKTDKFDKAVEQFFDLVAAGIKNPEYYYYMGRSLQELNNSKEGVLYYKSAYNLDSTHLRSIFQLGKHYVIKKEKDSVFKYVNTGLRFYENDVSLINWKALALFNNYEYEKAIPWFERLLELGEEKEYIYNKLAHCYFKNWEFEKAKNIYKILLEIDDTNDEAYFNLGGVYLKNEQLDSAKIFIKKSIEVQKVTFEKQYGALGGIERQENNLKRAMGYYKLAFKEDPANITNYYQICALADQYYEDPKIKLQYYENLIEKFGTEQKYFSEFAAKRISVLKEEIHFNTD